MGIGNTTTSSAMASVFLGKPVEELTGRGAGLSSEGLARKIQAIKKAIRVNQPDPEDPVDVLAKIGGFDIAGMAGVFLGGAALHMPVVIDGFISCVAALTAMRICPQAADYMMASHVSREPAAELLLASIGKRAFLTCDMCLGEGSEPLCCSRCWIWAWRCTTGWPPLRKTTSRRMSPELGVKTMLHLITGGSGSGKSRYAEDRILKLGPGRRVYVATMYPYDDESFQRIRRHRAMRAQKEFETIECYTALGKRSFPRDPIFLLECMSNLVANEMFRPEGARLHTVEAVLRGVWRPEGDLRQSGDRHQRDLLRRGGIRQLHQSVSGISGHHQPGNGPLGGLCNGSGIWDPHSGERRRDVMKSLINSFVVAFSMYSKIPMPGRTGPKRT